MLFGLFQKRKKGKPTAGKVVKSKEKAEVIGTVTHYFPHCKAAVIKLKKPIRAGERILITGHTTNFSQKISSLQMDNTPIETAKEGLEVGIRVKKRVRIKDTVYRTP